MMTKLPGGAVRDDGPTIIARGKSMRAIVMVAGNKHGVERLSESVTDIVNRIVHDIDTEALDDSDPSNDFVKGDLCGLRIA